MSLQKIVCYSSDKGTGRSDWLQQGTSIEAPNAIHKQIIFVSGNDMCPHTVKQWLNMLTEAKTNVIDTFKNLSKY